MSGYAFLCFRESNYKVENMKHLILQLNTDIYVSRYPFYQIHKVVSLKGTFLEPSIIRHSRESAAADIEKSTRLSSWTWHRDPTIQLVSHCGSSGPN